MKTNFKPRSIKHLMVLFLFSLILSCNTVSKKEASKTDEDSPITVKTSTDEKQVKETSKETFLCTINGKDWAYTKASGIISKDRKTNKRMALMTFTKKLEKGSESIQLRYDADSFELLIASIQLRFKSKEGKPFTCYYELFPDTKKKSPNATMVGSIDLSSSSTASGNAEITNLSIKYESEKLKDPKNAIINVSGLEFSAVGYSDVDKLANTFK